ncbi:MAG TPA: thiamine phosphate synthase [Alphaproteobacteria bacterium]|nr:thiamine phosphate synthase [Alphaproteobacteria bacterium]HNS43645.1 thiamine phosphate synthase [Alphaproteobacteria bacterium]
MNDLFDYMERELDELIEEAMPSAPTCGLLITLPDTDDHEALNFKLTQALHAANRFSTYAINRHVVLYHPADKDQARWEQIARVYRETCAKAGFIFLVMDNVKVARAVDADGVLCSKVMACSEARKTLDDDKIIGLRASTRAMAQSALSLDLDFVSFHTAPHGEPLLDLLHWWATTTEAPVAIEGTFDQENCAPFVAAGATFIESGPHIWTHPSNNPMQGTVNMLDAFERHNHSHKVSVN